MLDSMYRDSGSAVSKSIMNRRGSENIPQCTHVCIYITIPLTNKCPPIM